MHFHDMRWLEDIIYRYMIYIYIISWPLCQLSCRCAWLLRGSLIICVVTVPNISHNCLYMVLYYPQMYVCVHTLVVMLPHVPVGIDACWNWNHRFQVCHGKVSIVQKASLYCTFLSMSVCLVFSKTPKHTDWACQLFLLIERSQIPRQSTGSWGFQCIESPNTNMPLLNHWWYPLSLALSANIGWTFVIIGNLNTEAQLPSICQTGGGLIWASNKNWSLGNFEVPTGEGMPWHLRKGVIFYGSWKGRLLFSKQLKSAVIFRDFPSICVLFGLAKKNDTGKIWPRISTIKKRQDSFVDFFSREVVAGWQQRARLFAWAASCRNWTIELQGASGMCGHRNSRLRVFLVCIWHSCQSRGNKSHRKWIYVCKKKHISGSECKFRPDYL